MGENLDEFGFCFLDMFKVYILEYCVIVYEVVKKFGIKFDEGVYIGVIGLIYEILVEICVYKILGVDVVGMFIVFEVIVAVYLGLKVLGILCIINFAVGF